MITVVDVAWTDERPVVPDQHWSRFVVEAGSPREAELLATQWAASRPGVQMPTRSEIMEVSEV